MNTKSPFAVPTPRQIAPARRTTQPAIKASRRGRMFAFGAGVTALAGTAVMDEQTPVEVVEVGDTVAEVPAPSPDTTEVPPAASVESIAESTVVEPVLDEPTVVAEQCDSTLGVDAAAGDANALGCRNDWEPPVPTTVVETASVTTIPAVPTAVPESSILPELPVIEDSAEQPSIPAQPAVGWPIRAIRFPVAGPVKYSDDWGNCRGGDGCPRHHIGNDVIADRLQPLLAATDGVISHVVDNHSTAGWGLVITDADGWSYNYYHMNNDTPGTDDGADDGTWRFATGIGEGSTVTAGQVIGWVGDSGNSETSVPHVHFEIEDPSGNPINPYPSLRLAEWVGRCSNLGDPFREVLFPMAPPTQATMIVPTPTGGGQFFLSPDGTWVPIGDAKQVGDSAHAEQDPGCDTPYGAMFPAINGTYELGRVLQTIRTLESGGNYTAQAAKSSASGAYQFIDSTWRSLGGTGRARDASPAEQDMRAALSIERILAQNGGDLALVPVVWYIGSVPQGSAWDTVPVPGAGNVLTPRGYQAKWLAIYNSLG